MPETRSLHTLAALLREALDVLEAYQKAPLTAKEEAVCAEQPDLQDTDERRELS